MRLQYYVLYRVTGPNAYIYIVSADEFCGAEVEKRVLETQRSVSRTLDTAVPLKDVPYLTTHTCRPAVYDM